MFGLLVLAFFLILWGRWYQQIARAFAPAVSTRLRVIVGLMPILSLTAFVVLFLRYADASALDDEFWCWGFPTVCIVCLRLTVVFLHGLQIQLPADVTERNNPAVLPAFAGALLGVTALNVGSNLGQGDEAYTTLFPLALTLLVWATFVVLTARYTPLISAVVMTRDWLSSIQLGLVWLTAGLVLARAAAGDWVSFGATTVDILGTLPALAVLLGITEWLTRRNRGAVLLPFACLALAAISLALPHASTWHLP